MKIISKSVLCAALFLTACGGASSDDTSSANGSGGKSLSDPGSIKVSHLCSAKVCLIAVCVAASDTHKSSGSSPASLLTDLFPPAHGIDSNSHQPVDLPLLLFDLLFLPFDLCLLFFDGIEHGPDNRVVVDQQVALAVFDDGFGNDLLHSLR